MLKGKICLVCVYVYIKQAVPFLYSVYKGCEKHNNAAWRLRYSTRP